MIPTKSYAGTQYVPEIDVDYLPPVIEQQLTRNHRDIPVLLLLDYKMGRKKPITRREHWWHAIAQEAVAEVRRMQDILESRKEKP